MEDKASTKDLRDARSTVEVVKKYASDSFGFKSFIVEPLEADGNDPSKYCMFEVCGVQYQVRDGKLSIYEVEK